MSVEITTKELFDRAAEFGIYPQHVGPRDDFKGDRLTENHADLIALEARITVIKGRAVPYYGFADEIPDPSDD